MKKITTYEEFENAPHIFTLSNAEVGELWDDYFDPEDDPMERYQKLWMVYCVKYPNNSDVPIDFSQQ